LLVALVTLVGALIQRAVSATNLVMLYLLGVVIAAVYLGRGPAVVASAAGVLAFDFFFVPPSLSLAVEHIEYVLSFLALFAVGLVVSGLVAQVRRQVDAARLRERETAALYGLSQHLAAADDLEAIVEAVVQHVGQSLGRRVAVLLPKPDGGPLVLTGASDEGSAIDVQELDLATRVLRSGVLAGYGTETFPQAQALYVPLRTARGMVGVMEIRASCSGCQLSLDKWRMVTAFASQAALAIERAQLAGAARQVELLQATDRLQTALLNSISHDLRTPLVTITGTLSALDEDDPLLESDVRRAMARAACEEAERLNHLVENLLSISRIEAGALRLSWQPGDLADAVGSALDRLSDRLEGHPIVLIEPDDLPLLPFDFVLIVQVLTNLIDNALKYSAPDSPIEVRLVDAGAVMRVEVADRGMGVPVEDLGHIFDKFFRVQRPDSVAGTGLGLSIARGIVEAHGGCIRAENRTGGGTLVSFTLPKETGGGVSW